MKLKRNPFWKRVLIDIITINVLLLPAVLLRFLATPFKRGFYCDDEAIRYPFKNNTVTAVCLILLATVGPLTTFLVVEKLRIMLNQTKRDEKPIFWFEVYKYSVYYLIGLAISTSITFVCKFSTGRLRPHFIAICDPNITCVVDKYEYIFDYECRNQNLSAVDEARQSFMSGHSSIICFAVIFLILYLHLRINWKSVENIKIVIQTLLLLISICVAVSRINDNWHHWDDVVIGCLQGSILAFITVFFISDLKGEEEEEETLSRSP
ncbi:hypothetical protein B4U79_10301 [Dinothrombium tinctorium]|uniref:Phosphatidic acid phosphatase type 2/haloperoxidase domain-containing protein n=1 Tax=Dinothrombium tinctorium TaxID=1965070 RepID=A0A443RBF6_9ACAR|nr:hypothetical protein B4U79_00951 [Dinothrombium tinctorium]RWS12601.1 hypothetical protein B4U79_10301 [Dinothrombium tinctorium]